MLERSQTAQLHSPNLPLRFPLRNPGPGVVLKVKKNKRNVRMKKQKRNEIYKAQVQKRKKQKGTLATFPIQKIK